MTDRNSGPVYIEGEDLLFDQWCDEVDRVARDIYEFEIDLTRDCGREAFRDSYNRGTTPEDEVYEQVTA